jgi:inosine-uridine nucleoside N-ribohydrolase
MKHQPTLRSRTGRVAFAAVAAAALVGGAVPASAASRATPASTQAARNTVRLIIDTDIKDDVDDTGALAIANKLQEAGEAKLIGIMVSTHSKWGAGAVDAIDTYYRHPNIPIGAVKPLDNSVASRDYASVLAKKFPNDIRTGENAPDAVTLYRKLLVNQPNHSVTIASVGYLTNLSQLLDSKPDRYSSLNGRQLVKQKVKQLVVMGGTYPSGREFNFYGDVAATRHVTSSWPTPQVYSGFEVGEPVMTGARLTTVSPSTDPVRKAYEIYVGHGNNRNSWDPTAVYYAIRGDDGLFKESAPGRISIADDGSDTFTPDANGTIRYLVSTASNETIARALEDVMVVRTATP